MLRLVLLAILLVCGQLALGQSWGEIPSNYEVLKPIPDVQKRGLDPFVQQAILATSSKDPESRESGLRTLEAKGYIRRRPELNITNEQQVNVQVGVQVNIPPGEGIKNAPAPSPANYIDQQVGYGAGVVVEVSPGVFVPVSNGADLSRMVASDGEQTSETKAAVEAPAASPVPTPVSTHAVPGDIPTPVPPPHVADKGAGDEKRGTIPASYIIIAGMFGVILLLVGVIIGRSRPD